MTITFDRTALTKVVRQLPPFDVFVLVGLALAADPVHLQLSTSWDQLGERLGLTPALLHAVLERLCGRGFVKGQVDRTEGIHIHLDALLVGQASVPSNLPFEPTV